ncbi:Uu.00g050740.m01.CDS01 [Anthostomella pinea]|uniref:Uu.00g050740.m01.CDS01 n=1 Tax=Anthostomella pinea TaxID=933095 RepID=A0AAI8VSQ9_9PEZI|nr:Uu.00g050740.m01.CDS01 [Anthostomella pinea]
MKSFTLLPASMASLVLAVSASASLSVSTPPSIYVLMPSAPATTGSGSGSAVAEALNILGYSQWHPPHADHQTSRSLSPDTYAVLAFSTEYVNISRSNPDARFILPIEPKTRSSRPGPWLGALLQTRSAWRRKEVANEYAETVRDFFAREEASRQLLELDVDAPRSDAQAQTWVALCDFLGLGYSVVERLKLWRFP